MKRLVLAGLLCAAIFFAPAVCRAEEVELEDMVVTGTRTKRKITEVPAAISVVTKEELKQSRGWNVGEVLESIAGVQSQTKGGGYGYDTHIIIRGAGAKAAYGVRGIMIMVDGIPITDPDSLSRLDVVDTSLIERIEVLKGPSSTLYGANAAGGVINIITKDALGYQGLSLKSSFGSYNSQNYNLSYGGQSGENLFYFLSGSYRSSDSWRKHNKFDTEQFNAKFNYLLDATSSIDFLLSYSQANKQSPGSLTKEQFESDPSQISPKWPKSGRYSETTRFTLGYDKEFSGGNEFKGQLYFQDWEHFHPVSRGINDGGSNVFGAELQLNVPHKLKGTENVLTLGLSGQRDDRDSKKYTYRDWNPTPPYTSSDNTGEIMKESKTTVAKWGVYFQESLRPSHDLLIDVGVRYDEVTFNLDEEEYIDWVRTRGSYSYQTARNTIDSEKTWSKVNPRIGINYSLTEAVNLYGTVGTGFQTPTRGELATNTDIKPQDAINYETGLKGRFAGGHSMDLALFYTKIDEEIIKLMDSDGNTYYGNAGETLHKGVEVSGRVQLLKGLYFGGSYAYSDFTLEKFEETTKGITYSRDGNRIQLVPMQQYSFFLDYRHPSGINAKASTNTWGKYYVDAANSETYKGFTVVNAKLGYDWEQFSFFFRVDNVFDKKYAAEVSKSYGVTSYSPAAPRTWTAGVNYQF